MPRAKATILACAAALLLGGLMSSTASAYGPSGLGANLHRRFVIKQAIKKSRRGLPVRNSAILWTAGPRSSGMWVVRSKRRW